MIIGIAVIIGIIIVAIAVTESGSSGDPRAWTAAGEGSADSKLPSSTAAATAALAAAAANPGWGWSQCDAAGDCWHDSVTQLRDKTPLSQLVVR